MAYKIYAAPASSNLPVTIANPRNAHLQHVEDPKVVFNRHAGENGLLSWEEAQGIKLGYEVVARNNKEILDKGQLSFKDQATFLAASRDPESDNDFNQMSYQEWKNFVFVDAEYPFRSPRVFEIVWNRDASGFKGFSRLPRCQEDHVSYEGRVGDYNPKTNSYEPLPGAVKNEDAIKLAREAVRLSIRDTIRDTWPQEKAKIIKDIGDGNLSAAYENLRFYLVGIYFSASENNPHTASLCLDSEGKFFQLEEMISKSSLKQAVVHQFWQDVGALMEQIMDEADKKDDPEAAMLEVFNIKQYRLTKVNEYKFMSLVAKTNRKLKKRIQKLEANLDAFRVKNPPPIPPPPSFRDTTTEL